MPICLYSICRTCYTERQMCTDAYCKRTSDAYIKHIIHRYLCNTVLGR